MESKISWHNAKALLEWQMEMGVDEAVGAPEALTHVLVASLLVMQPVSKTVVHHATLSSRTSVERLRNQ